jgi:hypothetical protein
MEINTQRQRELHLSDGIYISTNLEQRERIEGAIHRGTYGRSDHHFFKKWKSTKCCVG